MTKIASRDSRGRRVRATPLQSEQASRYTEEQSICAIHRHTPRDAGPIAKESPLSALYPPERVRSRTESVKVPRIGAEVSGGSFYRSYQACLACPIIGCDRFLFARKLPFDRLTYQIGFILATPSGGLPQPLPQLGRQANSDAKILHLECLSGILAGHVRQKPPHSVVQSQTE